VAVDGRGWGIGGVALWIAKWVAYLGLGVTGVEQSSLCSSCAEMAVSEFRRSKTAPMTLIS